LPTQIEEKNSIGTVLRRTTMAYDSKGTLTSRSIADVPNNVTRTWTWAPTYDATVTGALVQLVEDGPRTDVADLTMSVFYAPDASCAGPSLTGCRGQLASVTNALGHVTNIEEYNGHGQPRRIVDPNGLVTTLDYDPRQRLISRQVGSELTLYEYYAAGQLKKVTNPDESFLAYEYDPAHRLTKITDKIGNRIEYLPDSMGNWISERIFAPSLNDPVQTRTRVFDKLNRLSKEVGALDQTTEFGYDGNGNVTTTKDPLARVTTNEYDAHNRLTKVIDPQNGPAATTRYAYNALDHLLQVIDPRKLVTSYTRNAFGEVTTQMSPDTGTTQFGYNATGGMTSKLDARGVQAQFTRDALNRMTQAVYPAVGAVPAQTVVYTFDQGPNGKGRMTSMTDRTGSTTWQHDAHGRVTRKQQNLGTRSLVVEYGFGANSGKLDFIRYPSGRQVNYWYDVMGQVSAIHSDNATVVMNVQHHPFGRPKSWTYGNGQMFSRVFDTDGRIASHTLGTTQRTIGYDPASRISGFTHGDTTLNQTFVYDNLDRVTGWTAATTSQGFSYDPSGNRNAHIIGGTTYPYSVDPASNRLLSRASGNGTVTYTHDAAGNRTGVFNGMEYGGDGRLTKYGSGPAGINGLGQLVTGPNFNVPLGDHAYDEDGRFLGRYVSDGSMREELLFLGSLPIATMRPYERVFDNLSSATSSSGTWSTSSTGVGFTNSNYQTYVPGPDAGTAYHFWRFYSSSTPAGIYRVYVKYVAGPDRASNAQYTITHAGGTTTANVNQQTDGGEWVSLGVFTFTADPLHGVKLHGSASGIVVADAVKYESQAVADAYYIQPDHLDTPRIVTGSNGQIVWRWDTADPFGMLSPSLVSGGIEFRHRFPGQFDVSPASLFYNYFRDYDPSIGRYIQSDPIGLQGGINTYAYVGSNPLSWSDPYGLAIGDFPPPPPGYNPKTWQQGSWDNGRIWLRDPDGRTWTAHPEDKNHWRHWDKQDSDGDDDGRWPPNSKKPWPGQKRIKPDQCVSDPSGDAKPWTPLDPNFAPGQPPYPWLPWYMSPTPGVGPGRAPFRVPIFVP
jgi:RHS repeat-associated protein